MRLLIPQLEELNALMLRLPALVDAVEREEVGTHERAREWLAELERAFERNRLGEQAAALASLRAELHLAVLGAMPASLTFAGQPRSRRVREAALLDVLSRAERTVAAALSATLTVHEEAERTVRQLIAIARHKGVAGPAPRGSSEEQSLRDLWQVIGADPDLANGAVRVLGLVGEADALALLDRALSVA